MERSLDQALQGNLAILNKLRPEDLDAPTPSASWDSARSSITSSVRPLVGGYCLRA